MRLRTLLAILVAGLSGQFAAAQITNSDATNSNSSSRADVQHDPSITVSEYDQANSRRIAFTDYETGSPRVALRYTSNSGSTWTQYSNGDYDATGGRLKTMFVPGSTTVSYDRADQPTTQYSTLAPNNTNTLFYCFRAFQSSSLTDLDDFEEPGDIMKAPAAGTIWLYVSTDNGSSFGTKIAVRTVAAGDNKLLFNPRFTVDDIGSSAPNAYVTWTEEDITTLATRIRIAYVDVSAQLVTISSGNTDLDKSATHNFDYDPNGATPVMGSDGWCYVAWGQYERMQPQSQAVVNDRYNVQVARVQYTTSFIECPSSSNSPAGGYNVCANKHIPATLDESPYEDFIYGYVLFGAVRTNAFPTIDIAGSTSDSRIGVGWLEKDNQSSALFVATQDVSSTACNTGWVPTDAAGASVSLVDAGNLGNNEYIALPTLRILRPGDASAGKDPFYGVLFYKGIAVAGNPDHFYVNFACSTQEGTAFLTRAGVSLSDLDNTSRSGWNGRIVSVAGTDETQTSVDLSSDAPLSHMCDIGDHLGFASYHDGDAVTSYFAWTDQRAGVSGKDVFVADFFPVLLWANNVYDASPTPGGSGTITVSLMGNTTTPAFANEPAPFSVLVSWNRESDITLYSQPAIDAGSPWLFAYWQERDPFGFLDLTSQWVSNPLDVNALVPFYLLRLDAHYNRHLTVAENQVASANGWNNERKITYFDEANGGQHELVYVTHNHLFYTHSTNNGAAWSNEVLLDVPPGRPVLSSSSVAWKNTSNPNIPLGYYTAIVWETDDGVDAGGHYLRGIHIRVRPPDGRWATEPRSIQVRIPEPTQTATTLYSCAPIALPIWYTGELATDPAADPGWFRGWAMYWSDVDGIEAATTVPDDWGAQFALSVRNVKALFCTSALANCSAFVTGTTSWFSNWAQHVFTQEHGEELHYYLAWVEGWDRCDKQSVPDLTKGYLSLPIAEVDARAAMDGRTFDISVGNLVPSKPNKCNQCPPPGALSSKIYVACAPGTGNLWNDHPSITVIQGVLSNCACAGAFVALRHESADHCQFALHHPGAAG